MINMVVEVERKTDRSRETEAGSLHGSLVRREPMMVMMSIGIMSKGSQASMPGAKAVSGQGAEAGLRNSPKLDG
jgi:hypothetical protein